MEKKYLLFYNGLPITIISLVKVHLHQSNWALLPAATSILLAQSALMNSAVEELGYWGSPQMERYTGGGTGTKKR